MWNELNEMAITEFIFPVYKPDQETLIELTKSAPEIFSNFRGVEGLKSLFRGKILIDNGQAVESDSGRGVIALEWDELSSFHSFYPQSAAFQGFLTKIKPHLAGGASPQLFESSSRSTHCLLSSICQVIKALKNTNTEKHWKQLQTVISESNIGAPSFFGADGVEDEQDYFLGLVGWRSFQDYKETGLKEVFKELVNGITVEGKGYSLVVQLTQFEI
ncbi:hypothetical protein HJFPF1_12347 [Paramyrothecium foliicola]|nr:hypothetical protein HJFPF1_12347 [Paramyrothecium foliicola]